MPFRLDHPTLSTSHRPPQPPLLRPRLADRSNLTVPRLIDYPTQVEPTIQVYLRSNLVRRTNSTLPNPCRLTYDNP